MNIPNEVLEGDAKSCHLYMTCKKPKDMTYEEGQLLYTLITFPKVIEKEYFGKVGKVDHRGNYFIGERSWRAEWGK